MKADDAIPYLVDAAAFVDRINLSVSGSPYAKAESGFVSRRSLPIAGEKSLYARALHLTDSNTGQHIELKYGRLKRNFTKIPAIGASFCSGRTPLSAAQVTSLLSRVVSGPSSHHISSVEMTFDLSKHSVFEIMSQIHARSLPHSKYWHQGLQTFYVGSRLSAWSMRVYQKAAKTTRIEFIFRRSFLKAKKISDLDALVRLRTLNISSLAQFRVIDPTEFQNALNEVPARVAALVARQIEAHPQFVERTLRREYRIETDRIFKVSPLKTHLLKMQRNFIW
jgi:hypothetical protein